MKKDLAKIFDDYVQREYWGVHDLSIRERCEGLTEDDVEFDYEGEEENE